MRANADPGGIATATAGPAPQAQTQMGGWGRGPRGPGGGRPGGRPSQYATRDLTSGSIPKNLLFLAWPQMVEGLLRIADQLADLIWAGFLGHRAIAGMGAAQQFTMLGFTARMGMDMSMRAMVSRAIGMGDTPLANRVVIHAIVITLVYSLLLVVGGWVLTDWMLRVIGISDAVILEGAGYMRMQFLAQASIGMQTLAAHSLNAAGDSMTPMKATLVSRVLHLALSPVLVFGVGFIGLPGVGLPGAALANFIAHVVALAMLAWVLIRGTSRLHLTLEGFHFEASIFKQLIKIGAPASINGMERSMSQLLILALVAPFGDLMVAAYALSRRVEMLGQSGMMGLGNSAGTIVGQNLGAGKPERAKQTILWGIGMGLSLKTVLTILIVAFSTMLLGIFTRDEQLIEIGRDWVLIQAVGYIPMGMNMIFGQSFQTAGATLFVMLVNLGLLWGLELPIALVLSRFTDLGALGVAWAMVIPMLVRPFIYVPYYLSGRWMRVRVFS